VFIVRSSLPWVTNAWRLDGWCRSRCMFTHVWAFRSSPRAFNRVDQCHGAHHEYRQVKKVDIDSMRYGALVCSGVKVSSSLIKSSLLVVGLCGPFCSEYRVKLWADATESVYG
jgi:hypothetical protein